MCKGNFSCFPKLYTFSVSKTDFLDPMYNYNIDSEYGLNSKITFGTKESFGQITEELTDILQTSDRSETGNIYSRRSIGSFVSCLFQNILAKVISGIEICHWLSPMIFFSLK